HVGVAHVPPAVLGLRVQVSGTAVVGGGVEGVEDPHTEARLDQGVDDVGADEPGPAGDEDPGHNGNRTTNRHPAPSLATTSSPPWASTIPRAMASPNPVPPPGVRAASPRKATSKTRSRSGSGMPPQASATAT